ATPVQQKQLDTQPRVELAARRAGAQLQRTIFTAENTNTLTGKVARQEGDPKTDDATVNEAYDWLGVTYNFFWDSFGRNSIDGNGMPLHATVHYSQSYNNAFWNGSQIVLGDGDGILFNRFTIALDITAKEFANGFLTSQTRLEYWQQSGAIFDSSAIVF